MARGRALSDEEREEISRGIVCGASGRVIARWLGRHSSVVTRGIGRHGGRWAYRAADARRRAVICLRRPKPRRVEADPRLLGAVNRGLALRWSPQQISPKLRMDFPDEEAMRVSQEVIYQALFVPATGQLTARLVGRLRSGRVRRVSLAERRAVGATKQAIPGMVMLTERPAEVADRAVPGHGEGDLLMGKGNASVIATLVERSSRFVILQRLYHDHSAERTGYALTAA